MRDPTWRPPATPRRIMVYVASPYLDIQRPTELAFARHNQAPEVTFVPSVDVWFPGREYTGEELLAAVNAHRIEAVLIVAPNDAGTSVNTTPNPFYSVRTTCSSSTANTNCRTTPQGGTPTWNVTRPWANYHIKLYDVATGHGVAWTGFITSSGNGFASWSQVREMVVRRTLRQLEQDGVIGQP